MSLTNIHLIRLSNLLPLNTKSFLAIDDVDTKYRLQAVKDHTGLILDLEERIRYQYELCEKTFSHLSNNYDPSQIQTSSVGKRITISHSLYTQNLRAIHALYNMILSGKLAASRIIVRRIHESILEQYYVGLCDESDFSKYIESSKNPFTRKSKSDHNFYKHKLYEGGDVMDEISSSYSKLSKFTHSTWTTIFDIEYNLEHVKYDLSNLRHLSLFNVLSYCQIYTFDKSFLKILSESIQQFVYEYLFDKNYKINNLFPNNKKIVDKLLWNPARDIKLKMPT